MTNEGKLKEVSDLEMCKAVTAFFLGTFHSKSYQIKREGLTLAFENMSLFSKESLVGKILNDILRKSLLYGEQTKDEFYLRRHKAFVMRYFSKMTHKEIGENLSIGLSNIPRDIEAVFDKIMIFTYGIDGLMPEEAAEVAIDRRGKEKVVVPKMDNTNLESYALNKTKKRKELMQLTERVMPEFVAAVSMGDYSECHFILEKQFSNYGQLKPSDSTKEVLDQLLGLHSDYADYSESKDIVRRYQFFEMKYIKGLDNSNIARQAGINLYALYLECREVIKDMLFIAYGVKSNEDESRIYGQRG